MVACVCVMTLSVVLLHILHEQIKNVRLLLELFLSIHTFLIKLFHCAVDCSCFAPSFVEFTCFDIETNLCAMKSQAVQFPIGWCLCISFVIGRFLCMALFVMGSVGM